MSKRPIHTVEYYSSLKRNKLWNNTTVQTLLWDCAERKKPGKPRRCPVSCIQDSRKFKLTCVKHIKQEADQYLGTGQRKLLRCIIARWPHGPRSVFDPQSRDCSPRGTLSDRPNCPEPKEGILALGEGRRRSSSQQQTLNKRQQEQLGPLPTPRAQKCAQEVR